MLVAHLDVPTGDQKVAGSTPAGWQHAFMEIDLEIFSGERKCTIMVNSLED